MFTDKQIKRFWNHVDVRGVNECWNWKLSVDRDGYGKACFGEMVYVAHRVAFALGHRTEIPDSSVEIRHSCDNRTCCNPKHLVTGTHVENMQDMILRGRQAKATANKKLNQEKADQLRADFQNGESKRSLSRRYSISPVHVRQILKGWFWKS